MKKQELTPERIIRILEDHKEELREYGVKRIGLFGSFLKKNPKNNSDLDFLVVFNHPTYDNYMDLKFLLENIFKREVDLVTEKGLKPALDYVKKEAIYVEGI